MSDVADVFLSLGGCDRTVVRRLVRALREVRVTVFIDEDSIGFFEGITAEIEDALRSCRVMVVYYSAGYPSRPACQFELTTAFLAGQREGDPSRRLIVVNPEQGTDHIQPAELSDARFAVAPAGPREARELARLIRDRVAGIRGRLGDVDLTDRPRWYPGQVEGAPGFAGRYREQWALHSALFAADLPLTQEAVHGPVAVLAGLPGIGKTALAAAYAWQFGAAFRGGVHWISLAGNGADASARYADQVRAMAETMGMDCGAASRERVFGMVADELVRRGEPSLWVIDDVPPDLPPEHLRELLIPAGSRVRTLIITHREASSGWAGLVRVEPMTPEDARALLEGFRVAATVEDERAMDRIVCHVGGQAQALSLIGRELRDLDESFQIRSVVPTVEASGP